MRVSFLFFQNPFILFSPASVISRASSAIFALMSGVISGEGCQPFTTIATASMQSKLSSAQLRNRRNSFINNVLKFFEVFCSAFDFKFFTAPQFLSLAFCLCHKIYFLFSLEDYCPVRIICAYRSVYLKPRRGFEKELNVLVGLAVSGELIFYP